MRAVQIRTFGDPGEVLELVDLPVPVAASYPLGAFREAVAHAQRGGKVMFDIGGAD